MSSEPEPALRKLKMEVNSRDHLCIFQALRRALPSLPNAYCFSPSTSRPSDGEPCSISISVRIPRVNTDLRQGLIQFQRNTHWARGLHQKHLCCNRCSFSKQPSGPDNEDSQHLSSKLGRRRQGDCWEFKASPGYSTRTLSQNKSKRESAPSMQTAILSKYFMNFC